MRISRLDLLRTPNQPRVTAFPPIYFHKTTTRHTTRKPTTPPPPPPTTPTTTTTTSTTTRPRARPLPTVPVGKLRVSAEVIIDENRFQKPVKVEVHGKKVNAHFNVVPKHYSGRSGEVLHFMENPEVSRQLHYVQDPYRRHRHHFQSRHSPKPLHVRQHLLYRKMSRDPRPLNVIDEAVDSVVQPVAHFARSILPGIFGKNPETLPQPTMHKFDNIPFDQYPANSKQWRQQHINIIEKPSARKGNHLNNVERGLEDLINTDEEIPR